MKEARRRFLSPRRLLAFVGILALLFGALMLHPYPRQSLFGPTIHGKPRCYWEGEVRRYALGEQSFIEKALDKIGFKQNRAAWQDLFSDEEMTPIIIELLDEPNINLRQTLLEQIILSPALQTSSVLPALHKQMNGDDGHARILAAWAIWLIDRDKAALSVLTKALAEPHYCGMTMSYLLHAAGEAPELFPHIAAHAHNEENRVRIDVMQAMTHFGKKGVPTLIDGLKDDHFEVRIRAAQSLTNLGSHAKDAAPALELCLRDPDPDVRNEARAALQSLDPERYRNLKEEK